LYLPNKVAVGDRLLSELSEGTQVKSYKVEKSSSYHLSVDGLKQDFDNTTTFLVDHEFSRDSSGMLKLQTSYRRIEISDNQNGTKETVVVSENSSSDDQESQIWQIFLKSKPYVVWNTQGEVVRTGGLENLADSIFSNMNVDASTKFALRKKWQDAVTEMQQSLSQNLFPGFVKDSMLTKGSAWTVKVKDKALEIPVELETIFRLDSWNDTYANISSSASIDIDNVISSQVAGAKVQLKGEQKGEYKIDLSTGLVSVSIIKTNAKGSVQMLGKTIPVSIENEVRVEEQ
jgi:hypothetical protein